MTLTRKFLITLLVAVPVTVLAVKYFSVLSIIYLAPLYFVLAKRYFDNK